VSSRDSILVTGGSGYIGSHFARAAHEAGSRVVVLDDLSGVAHWPPYLPSAIVRALGDIANRPLVAKLIKEYQITSVVHFAGKICVAESIAEPALYFDHNVARSIALLDVVREVGPRTIVFSSTAAVYGDRYTQPIDERAATLPSNPYGDTKLAVERAIAAYGRAYGLRWAALRYFNAAGAHPDGTIREAHDPETHLIPLVIDAALGRRPPLTVFGTDYATKDGTCARDYVHVCDLADAHLAVIDAIDRDGSIGAINLGSGRAHTVLEVLFAAAHVLGHDVSYVIGPRRDGDPAVLLADVVRAREVLDWRPTRSDLGTVIDDAVRSRRG
jgi:UDP-glucose-4-epimerase GalE